MKKIVVLDTSVNNTNSGNKIIMEAVEMALREVFPHDIFYHVSALEYISAGRKLVKGADHIFLGGTNVLSADMDKTSEWHLRISDGLWMNRPVILLGLGWWQYQSTSPNLYTRLLLKVILSRKHYHSLRDSYTANKLKSLGYNVLNTGCPTLWRLTKEHCAAIPPTKSESALLTFTEYNQALEYDRLLFEIVKRNYATIYFWPQMYGDYNYAKKIGGNAVVFIDPSIEALDHLLQSEDIDYIGTRLHAGIRALQHKRRAIIIGVDNRASEMGRDFNLPFISREMIASDLEDKIKSSWNTRVNIDNEAIALWKRQFNSLNQDDEFTMGKLKSIARKVLPTGMRRFIRRVIS